LGHAFGRGQPIIVKTRPDEGLYDVRNIDNAA
jgi:hypothetical protein